MTLVRWSQKESVHEADSRIPLHLGDDLPRDRVIRTIWVQHWMVNGGRINKA